jgi:hypothetical protein
MFDMFLKVAFQVVWLVDDIWGFEIIDRRWCPINHDGIFTSCKFQTEEKTFKRTSVIVWVDSHRMVNFITNGGRKEKDEPPPERKLANERGPLVENTITLT